MKHFRLVLLIVPIACAMIFGAWTLNARANQRAEREQIKETVTAYFDMRYRSRQNLVLEDFDGLIDNSSEAKQFLNSETTKLDIEVRHAKANDLGYSQYEYFLDFMDFSIDVGSSIATVKVIEGHDVIFEISKKLLPNEPILSSMRNRQHTIVVRKTNGVWKIVTDNYEDYLWKILRSGSVTAEELSASIDKPLSSSVPNASVTASSSICSFPDDLSTREYDRDGAVAYAHEWATAPPPYNPKYFNYTDEGGDCTNFINQAIHEGGGAPMYGQNTFGWYYKDKYDKSASWTDVQSFFNFVVVDWDYAEAGPEGCETEFYLAYEGDIIQYDWQNDGAWDHSVIIVRSEDYGTYNRYHWIAAHTEDFDNYPYTEYRYENPNFVYRFIRIERVDGYATAIPLVAKSDVAKNQSAIQDPYPAPLEYDNTKISNPYPGPSQNSASPEPYPAP